MMIKLPADFLTILIFIGALLVSLFIVVWPVQWAAKAMGARRTGFGWCLLALMVASILQGLGGSLLPVAGNLVALLLAALAFAVCLETSYLRGVGIALLHLVFTVLLLFGLALLLGVGVAGFGMG